MASFEFLAIILTGLGLIVSILYYTTVLQNANKTRQTQILMNLYETYRNPEFAEMWGEVTDREYTDFDDYWQKYGAEVNRSAWSSFQSVARVFHGVGVLLKRRMVDIELVEELLGNIILISWIKMGPIILGFREMTLTRHDGLGRVRNFPPLSGFDYINNELKKRQKA